MITHILSVYLKYYVYLLVVTHPVILISNIYDYVFPIRIALFRLKIQFNILPYKKMKIDCLVVLQNLKVGKLKMAPPLLLSYAVWGCQFHETKIFSLFVSFVRIKSAVSIFVKIIYTKRPVFPSTQRFFIQFKKSLAF